MAETVTTDLTGAQAQDVNVYQSAIRATYTCTETADGNGTEIDLGAPKVASARLTVVTLTGTTQLLDVKLQSKPTADDDWVDVTDGAFTQTNAAGDEVILVILHRLVRVVRNYTNTITAPDWNVNLLVNN